MCLGCEGPFCIRGFATSLKLIISSGDPIPSIAEIQTPLKWSAWNWHLYGHQNRMWVECLLRGIANGLRVGFDGSFNLTSEFYINSKFSHPRVHYNFRVAACTVFFKAFLGSLQLMIIIFYKIQNIMMLLLYFIFYQI